MITIEFSICVAVNDLLLLGRTMYISIFKKYAKGKQFVLTGIF